ncbi:MAG: 4Fe-4S binding protein, partial [Lachnospiraceae bacterium]|nr:4Fe-4S binding protein [Lachnospiraceae bacterium]
GASQYEIDADACLECGSCAATCPNEAIVEE